MIIKIMRRMRTSRSWVLLALLAMLGIVSSPALAVNCCCIVPHGASAKPDSPKPTPDVDSHTGCHGSPSSASAHASINAPSAQTASQANAPRITAVCSCGHDSEGQLSAEEVQSLHWSSPLVVEGAVAAVTIARPAERTVRRLSDFAARPPTPAYATLPGRSPPAI